MKAVRIHRHGGADVLQVEQIERPTPGQGEVLIKVSAAGLNYADIGQRTGFYPHVPPLPAVLGFEVAGVIEALGEGVSQFAVGTRVVSLVNGGYAEYAIARAETVLPLPDAVSFEQAVVIPVQGQTAYLALSSAARLQHGETVLVHVAAGGVGSLAVQLAKLLGAGTVIGTTTKEEKMPFIRELGADVVINTKDERWVEKIMQATHGRGVDIVLDPIGGEVAIKSIASMAPFGRYINYGSLTGAPTQVMLPMLIGKCLSVAGYNTNIQPLSEQMKASQDIIRYIVNGQLKITLENSFALDEAAAAQQALEEGRTRGKVVLTV